CGEVLGALWDANPSDWFGPIHILGYVAGFVLAWVCASFVYRFRHAITPSVLKGFWVAGLQWAMLTLYLSLLAGIGFSALSVWHMLGYPGWHAAPKPAAALVAPAAVDRS
ncbi:MAG TPA: hypothetical protein VMS17_04540, partial [Gemmataceae bacterium]|nr:hypothetical protein [Gemmataceae bacterium]